MPSPAPVVLPGFPVPREKVFRSLVIAIAVLAAAFVVTQTLKVNGYGEQLGFRRLFNMDGEATLPAWFESTLMLAAAFLLAVIAAHKRAAGDRFHLGWWILAAGFLYLSADETAAIHEMSNRAGAALPIATEGLLSAPWVIFGILVVLVVGIGYLRFLANLPPATRWRFIIAGAVFVGGAIVVEMLSARVEQAAGLHLQPDGWEGRGDFTLEYMWYVVVEESLEMLGIVLFIDALLRYVQSERLGSDARGAADGRKAQA